MRVTESLGTLLAAELGLPVRVAMRFWHPFIEDVVDELVRARVHEICILPVAPFSVHIYVTAVSEALRGTAARAGAAASPSVVSVPPYGDLPSLVSAEASLIEPFLKGKSPRDTALILTAHSLPMRVLAAGDPYQREFEASAAAVSRALGWPASVAYQSQGADGGDWLGPTIAEVLRGAHAAGAREAVVAPIGFLADHVETLYDLDVEAKAVAESVGIGFTRVPALNDSPALVRCMAELVRGAFA